MRAGGAGTVFGSAQSKSTRAHMRTRTHIFLSKRWYKRYRSRFSQVSGQTHDDRAGTQLVTRPRNAALTCRSLITLNWGFCGIERSVPAYQIGGTHLDVEENPRSRCFPGS